MIPHAVEEKQFSDFNPPTDEFSESEAIEKIESVMEALLKKEGLIDTNKCHVSLRIAEQNINANKIGHEGWTSIDYSGNGFIVNVNGDIVNEFRFASSTEVISDDPYSLAVVSMDNAHAFIEKSTINNIKSDCL